MSRIIDLIERLRALVFRSRRERQMTEEILFHIEREVEERVGRGADPGAARREALAAFGNIEGVKEAVRDATGVRLLQDLGADFRYALRSLGRDSMYTTAAVTVLGLGLGAAATAFAVADSVLLSPLPYREPDRLVRVGQLYQQNSTVWQLSTVDAQAILEQQRSFEVFGLVAWRDATLSGAGTPEKALVGAVTSGFFRALEIDAAVGRAVAPEDESADAAPVAVVSHALAEQRLGGAEAAVGRALTIDGLSHIVIGVLPEGTDKLGGVRATAWPVLKLRPPERRGPFWLRGIGRLREGVTLDDAARDMEAISKRIFPLWASSFQDQTARIAPMPLRDTIVGDAGRAVGLFFAAVVLVLLVAIANVTTLSLARSSAREPERALRVTLGAGRVRLARLPLTEGLVTGLAAGLLGFGIAVLGFRVLGRLTPNLPRVDEVALDGRVVAFLIGCAILSGILVSISPMLAAFRSSSAAIRRGDGRRTGADRKTTALRSALVTAEFALALPLLLGSSLLFVSFSRLQRVDVGFDPEGVVSISLALPDARYPGYSEFQTFWLRLEHRVAEVPGALASGLASELPPGQAGNINNFNLIDRPVQPGVAEHLAPWLFVTPGFFDALQIPLLEGRWFTEADSATAPPVVMVSRWWAQRYYPGESAVGRQMIEGGCVTCDPTTVIGVVGDVKYLGLAESGNAVYSPLAQSQARTAHLVVRSRARPAITLPAVREVVAGLDPELSMEEQTLEARLADALTGPGRSTALLSVFALAAVALAAVGIFGLLSYTVRQRRREIGVRIALGAAPSAITRMVVGQGMSYAAAGTVVGLALTILEARWLESFLYGVSASDPLTTAAAAVALLLVAAVACWLPGFRASRIHAVEAISAE
ncbi:MAG TPA: ADOP family duplicated permease [Vicinamibacteria bacterium]|nr:ADOP family duplicated permease [Vicinamibacteria bacterium]